MSSLCRKTPQQGSCLTQRKVPKQTRDRQQENCLRNLPYQRLKAPENHPNRRQLSPCFHHSKARRRRHQYLRRQMPNRSRTTHRLWSKRPQRNPLPSKEPLRQPTRKPKPKLYQRRNRTLQRKRTSNKQANRSNQPNRLPRHISFRP